MLTGIVAAVLAALGYGVATVLQSQAVAPAGTPGRVLGRLFAVGVVVDGASWLVSLAAFRHLSLAAAQAVLASSVAVTAVIVESGSRTRVARRTWVAGGLFVLGSTLIASAAGPVTARHVTLASLGLAAAVLAVVGLLTARAYRNGSAMLLSVLAGAAFTGTAVYGGLLQLSMHMSFAALFDVGLVLGFSGLGLLAFARALTQGFEARVAAVMWTTELVLAVVAGVLVLGDPLHPMSSVAALIGVGAAVVACGMLGVDRPSTASSTVHLPVSGASGPAMRIGT
ncbi:hypothetical protein C6I20_05240 [Aeromicrobium sp. A1-2]|uniref:hypothetical protein n=1 Tax=Aeromicrobium sp. A1-2 TaxID=2107713 RepID=UPI000E51AAC3|nr:hypothetical protein [Aeromicrobium sp. A1-2]AXT84656.1 hypothetical protein C6I20_05240 [Aeromicrobium sp. A1-2]